MPTTDQNPICSWCMEPYVPHGRRKYHEDKCAHAANVHKMNVWKRHKALAAQVGSTPLEVAKRLQTGCEACRMISVSKRGPADSTYPKYRAYGKWLVCPKCLPILINNELVTEPVLEFMLMIRRWLDSFPPPTPEEKEARLQRKIDEMCGRKSAISTGPATK